MKELKEMTLKERLEFEGVYDKLPCINLNDVVYYPISKIKYAKDYIGNCVSFSGIDKMFIVKASRLKYLIRMYYITDDEWRMYIQPLNTLVTNTNITYLSVFENCTVDIDMVLRFNDECKNQRMIKNIVKRFNSHGIMTDRGSNKVIM